MAAVAGCTIANNTYCASVCECDAGASRRVGCSILKQNNSTCWRT